MAAWLHWERNAAIVVDMSSRRSLVGTGSDTVRLMIHWERNAAIVVDMSSRRSLVGTGSDTVRLMRLEE